MASMFRNLSSAWKTEFRREWGGGGLPGPVPRTYNVHHRLLPKVPYFIYRIVPHM